MRTSRLSAVLRRALVFASAAACGGTTIDRLESNDAGAAEAVAPPTRRPPAGPPPLTDAGTAAPDVASDAGAADAAPSEWTSPDGSARCTKFGDGSYCSGELVCTETLSVEECKAACGTIFGPRPQDWYCTRAATETPFDFYCDWNFQCSGGRRPEGFAPSANVDGSPVGAFFAKLAELEAASVDAFEILASELAAHGAPDHLRRAALRSARDEVRHTRITASLARRHGGSPCAPRVERRAVRDLETLAIENAVEGCVRETFGALVALAQSERASDPLVRKAMRRIAEDETRHAELSWAISEWATGALDAEQRARLRTAMDRAIDELEREVAASPPPELVDVAGLPPSLVARRLVRELRETLWQADG